MDAHSAESQIQDAITRLESNSGDTTSAFEFLNDLPGDFRSGINALRTGLDSKSIDAQLVCALAVGKFGRGSDWALNSLVDLGEGANTDPSVREAAYFAIANLETPEAAAKLAGLLQADIDMASNPYSIGYGLSALSTMGGLAIDYRDLFFQAWNKYNEVEGGFIGDQIASAYKKFKALIKTEYHHYRKMGLADSLNLESLVGTGIRKLDTSDVIQRFGKWNLITDQYFLFTTDNKDQIKHLPERVPKMTSTNPLIIRTLILQDDAGQIVVCGCLDEFSVGASIINRFDNFVHTLSYVFQLDANHVHWCSHTPEIMGTKMTGKMEPVSLQFYHDAQQVKDVRWGPESKLIELFGDSFEPIKTWIANVGFIPERFSEFVTAYRYEGRVKTEYQELRNSSPEGRLHYEDLHQAFGKTILPVITNTVAPQLPMVVSGQYGDSLNSQVDVDQFDGSLDYQLLEALKMAAQDEVCLPLPDNFFIDQALDKFNYPEDDIQAHSNTLNVDLFTSGVILLREFNPDRGITRLLTNVPRTVFGGSFGYNWGYYGSGPTELALNILNLYVPPGSDGFAEIEGSKVFWPPTKFTYRSLTAQLLAREFLQDFVVKIPRGGAFVSGERIQDWIQAKAFEARQNFL